MGIDVHWDGEDTTILRWTISGWWDWADFEAAAEHSRLLRAEVSHNVAIIVTIADDCAGPYGVMHIRYALMLSPDNRELVVVVTTHAAALHMLDTLYQLYPDVCQTLYCVATLDDAYALVDRHRALARSRTG